MEKGHLPFPTRASPLAGQQDKAGAGFEASNEIYPEGMACATLAAICEGNGEIEEAENYWRQATQLEPDRIFYWESLKRVLDKRRQFVEATKVDDPIYMLRFLLQ